MNKRSTLLCYLLLATLPATAQTAILRINPNITLPKDSADSKNLISSLDNFLQAAQKPNEENNFVFEHEKIETFIQLDELKDIEKSGKFKDDFFYKPYLTNVVLLKDHNYLVQVSYVGINKDTAVLRASFEFIAHKMQNTFMYSSPLLANTKNWKVEKVGNNIFHYQSTINKKKVKEFDKLASSFDKRLKTEKTTDYYLCDNLIELSKLTGVDYKSDYNGRSESVWSSSFGNKKLIIFGNSNTSFDNFDPHDLFHDRLGLVISRSKVNKAVDEGCAYLYGGSWGFSWKEIFKAFKEQVASDRATDWVAIKEKNVTFKTGSFSNSADYIVNALLIKKIEKEQGFSAVWQLLKIGPDDKENEKYYQMLEQLTGITKANYNNKVWELIDNEQ